MSIIDTIIKIVNGLTDGARPAVQTIPVFDPKNPQAIAVRDGSGGYVVRDLPQVKRPEVQEAKEIRHRFYGWNSYLKWAAQNPDPARTAFVVRNHPYLAHMAYVRDEERPHRLRIEVYPLRSTDLDLVVKFLNMDTFQPHLDFVASLNKVRHLMDEASRNNLTKLDNLVATSGSTVVSNASGQSVERSARATFENKVPDRLVLYFKPFLESNMDAMAILGIEVEKVSLEKQGIPKFRCEILNLAELSYVLIMEMVKQFEANGQAAFVGDPAVYTYADVPAPAFNPSLQVEVVGRAVAK